VDAGPGAIVEEVRGRFRDWYPDADPGTTVELVDVDPRARAHLTRIRVRPPDGPSWLLVAKAAGSDPQTDTADRPRLVDLTEPESRVQYEFHALRAIQERIEALGDPRLAAIRPLGVLPDSGAVVMESFDGRPLHHLLLRGRLSQDPARRPARLARTAGHWLRVFHDTEPSGQPVRQQQRADVVAAFEALGAYLSERSDQPDVGSIARIGIEAVGHLPDPLPTALSHGDFAPRNILVDPVGRVAVIDLLARWQAPRYEDIAGFLIALQTSRANALTQGVAYGPALGGLERPFLDGYFGAAPVPRAAIRVYELLLVLDKWAARASRVDARPGLRDRLIERHVAGRSRRLAHRLRVGFGLP
jgi:aminoglycoside phosphotransferase (APT) family kinase protein